MAQTLIAPPPVPRAGSRTTPPPSPVPAPSLVSRLRALTALRFFAAAMIVLLHMQGYFGDIPALAHFTLTQGVCFFYVLSGFILTYAYPHLERGGAARFFVGRLARIAPLYLIALLLYVLLLPAWFRDSVSSITPASGMLTLLLLQAWVPIYRVQTAFNGVSWSLSAEWFFSLCFPLLLWRWRQTWALKLALTLTLVAGMIAIANHGSGRLPTAVEARDLVYFHPLARLWEFALGMATAHVWRALSPRLRYGRGIGTAVEAGALGVTFAVMAGSGEWSRQAGQFPLVGPGGEAWLASSGWVCLPFAALILVTGLERGWITQLLALRPFVLLGEISFALYLLQLLVFHYYALHPEPFRATPPWLLHLGGGCLLLLVAYVGWALVEVPARRAIIRLWKRYEARDLAPTGKVQRTPTTVTPTRQWWANTVAVGMLIGIVYRLVMLPTPPLPVPAALNDMPATPGRARIAVDLIGKRPVSEGVPVVIVRKDYPSEAITVEGWSIDQAGQRLARGVLVGIDDDAGTWARYGSTRNDVSRYLDDATYLRSGYIAVLPLQGLSDGMHTVTIRALVAGTDTYSETTVLLRIV